VPARRRRSWWWWWLVEGPHNHVIKKEFFVLLVCAALSFLLLLRVERRLGGRCATVFPRPLLQVLVYTRTLEWRESSCFVISISRLKKLCAVFDDLYILPTVSSFVWCVCVCQLASCNIDRIYFTFVDRQEEEESFSIFQVNNSLPSLRLVVQVGRTGSPKKYKKRRPWKVQGEISWRRWMT
jgi:hypothetical protein